MTSTTPIVLVLLLSSGGAGCHSTSGSSGLAQADAFTASIERLRVTHHVPGLSGLVLRGDSVLWERSLGFRDEAKRLPATVGTRYHLASLTKPFAAAIIMQLVAEQRMTLEQPVRALVAGAAPPDTVRVWHLMSHTSEGVPGTSYSYSGDRFGQLDLVMLEATGKTFAQLYEERIRVPLGLTLTPAESLAQGYDYSAARRNVPVAYQTYFGPAAGMISTPREMALFSRALDGDRLLSPASRARMFAPIVTARGETLPYALGWFVQRYRGEAVQWHYGYWTGTSTLIIRVPGRGLTFVLMANNEMLSAPFNLGRGELMSSPFAEAFFRTFVD